MGDRNLSAALIALLVPLLVVAASPQGGGIRIPTEHRRAVRAERSARFFEAWSGADATARAAAAGLIDDLGGASLPSGRFPRLADITAATRVLEGREPATDDLVQRLADRIDLRVVPGIVPAREEGRGEPVVVHVSLLSAVERPDEARLSLLWRGPDGGEQHALGEPFAGASFATGFAMYPRAPVGVEGAFELVPIVEFDGRTGRGAPVPVPIVALSTQALDGRLAVRGDLAPVFAAGLLRQRLHGLREAFGVTPAEALAEVLGGAAPQRTFASRLSDVTDANGVRVRTVALGDGSGPVLVLVAPSTEAPAAVLSGPVGAAWRELGEKHDLVLCCAAVDPGGDEPLTRVFALARSAAPLVVVARGDAHTILQFAHLRDPAAFDGLVVSSDDGFLGKRLPAVPTLIAAPAGVGVDGDGQRPAYVTRVPGGPSAFLTELALPGLVDGWLGTFAAADESGD